MTNLTLLLLLAFGMSTAHPAEITQQFKDPTFSGNGWATQMMNVYQSEQASAQAIANSKASIAATTAANASNTPLAKFMELFESQVYSQLATQLSNNLFQNNCKDTSGNPISGCSAPTMGTFDLAGNTVTWQNLGTNVQLSVVDTTGNTTVMTVPIAKFAF